MSHFENFFGSFWQNSIKFLIPSDGNYFQLENTVLQINQTTNVNYKIIKTATESDFTAAAWARYNGNTMPNPEPRPDKPNGVYMYYAPSSNVKGFNNNAWVWYFAWIECSTEPYN